MTWFSARWRYPFALLLIVLAALFALALYVYYGAREVGNFGFPLDDSWIHLQIARNVAQGQGWSFNPGEATGASTAPLWVILLAPLFWLPGDTATWVKLLGSVLYVIDVLLIVHVAHLAANDRRVALIAGFFAAWQPAFVWSGLSGMETPLYLLFFLLSVRAVILAEKTGARSAYAATFWLVLAGWSRPELWAMLAVLWGYLFLRRREIDIGHWWAHLLVAGVGVGAFMLFNFSMWGHPFPTTFYAKTAHLHGVNTGGPVHLARQYAELLLYNVHATISSQNTLLLTSLALGGVLVWRRGGSVGKRLALLFGFVVAANVVLTMTNVGSVSFQTYRRATYVLACMNILTAVGAAALWDVLRTDSTDVLAPHGEPPVRPHRRPTFIALAVIVTVLAVGLQLSALHNWAQRYANDVRSINEGDVAAALWLADNTPADAVIAANDIGAIGFFGGRRVVDVVGLASPEFIPVLEQTAVRSPDREDRTKALMLSEGVDYAVLFPFWYPYLAQDPDLVEVQRFSVEDFTALAHGEVAVYQLQPPSP